MEKYLPDFDMTNGEYRYVVKSEIDQAIADVSNQKLPHLKCTILKPVKYINQKLRLIAI
ncbi:hypothetical protein MKR66_12770 [Acinetobacter baumannii]